LYVASITQHNVTMPAGSSEKFSNRIELSLLTNGRPQNLDDFAAVSGGIFANWLMEFGKIFHGKMWTLLICGRHLLIPLSGCIQSSICFTRAFLTIAVALLLIVDQKC